MYTIIPKSKSKRRHYLSYENGSNEESVTWSKFNTIDFRYNSAKKLLERNRRWWIRLKIRCYFYKILWDRKLFGPSALKNISDASIVVPRRKCRAFTTCNDGVLYTLRRPKLLSVKYLSRRTKPTSIGRECTILLIYC